MEENITQIKVGDDVRCISLDSLVLDTRAFARGGSGKLGVRLGSSMTIDYSGIGVKIHSDTDKYLQREPSGLSLKLSTMAKDMAGFMLGSVGFTIDAYNNLKMGTSAEPLMLGTGLMGEDSGKTLALNLGSGLEFGYSGKDIRLKLDDNQDLLIAPAGGPLVLNLGKLYQLLEARYNLTLK